MAYVALDLTDAFAKGRRAVDVCVLGDDLSATFRRVAPPQTDANAQIALDGISDWVAAVADPKRDVLVIDGPQGLARSGARLRVCEAKLRTPGRTPFTLPIAGAAPFSGYIRTSVLLFGRILADSQWRLEGNLYEGFPGAAWPVLAGRILSPKATRAGLDERRALLQAAGIRFDLAPESHDQLDAAVMSYLGWLKRNRPADVIAIGDASFTDGGFLREGKILHPVRAASPGASSVAQAAPTAPAPIASVTAPPPWDWVYFATPARADRYRTAELAIDEGVICRPARNRNGAAIANVGALRPGQHLLLAYAPIGGGVNYEVIGLFRVLTPPRPLADFPAIHRVDDTSLVGELEAYYPRDPIAGELTAILVDAIPSTDPLPTVAGRPVGNNAIWRAAKVAVR